MKKNKIFTIAGIVALGFGLLANKSISVNNVSKPNDSIITLIFKNPKIIDTIRHKGVKSYSPVEHPITYRFENEFIDHYVNVVKNVSDTIVIKTGKPIYMDYFSGFYSNYYHFMPGDVLVFEYQKNDSLPYVKNMKKIDKNYDYLTQFNVNYPTKLETEIQFFMKHNRHKNKEELKKDSLVLVKRDLKLVPYFDSLKNNRSISEIEHEMNISFSRNKPILKNTSPIDILKTSYNLSIPGNTFLIKQAFKRLFPIKYISTGQGSVQDFKKDFENAMSSITINSKNRDYLLFDALKNIAEEFSKETFKKYYALFETEVNDKSLSNYFKKKYPLLFTVYSSQNEVHLIDGNKSSKNLKDIISKYKGNVFYVDFWASWCAPCLASIPYSVKLKEKYKNKNVVFLYISIDKDAEQWQKAVKKENLPFVDSFLASNYPSDLMYKELQLKSIPRYIIFDKSGKLVNSNAPRPKENEIEQELDKYLSVD